MYKKYYFNKITDEKGNHEVHTDDCFFLPKFENREFIGYESSCNDAIERAKSMTNKNNFDGCYYCSYECHKG